MGLKTRGIGYILNSICDSSQFQFKPTSIHKNNETNDKFYRKVAFIMYTEMVTQVLSLSVYIMILSSTSPLS